MCNNCKEGGPDIECNYTPKKRNKPKGESDLARLTQEGSSKGLPPTPRRKLPKSGQGVRKGLTFYGQNIATDKNMSPKLSEPETTSDPDSSRTPSGCFDLIKPQASDFGFLPQKKAQTPSLPQLEFIAFESYEHKKRKMHDAYQEPWAHPSIIPLPGIVLKGLRTVIPYDMHQREGFDDKLRRFQSTMMEDLRETTCLSLDKYTHVARCLAKGDTSKLSERMRSWTSIHRLCSGSDEYSLILVPQDSVFSMDAATADTHRRNFVDALLSASDPEQLQVLISPNNEVYDQFSSLSFFFFEGPSLRRPACPGSASRHFNLCTPFASALFRNARGNRSPEIRKLCMAGLDLLL